MSRLMDLKRADLLLIVRSNFERGDSVAYTSRTLRLPDSTVRSIEKDALHLFRRSIQAKRLKERLRLAERRRKRSVASVVS